MLFWQVVDPGRRVASPHPLSMQDSDPAPAADGQPRLRKSLGLFDGIALLIGITIGAGIFSTPSKIAAYSESFYPIILLWVVCAGFVFIGGLIYAELGTRVPKTGGEYVYIHQAFGPFAAFMFGWAQLIIVRTSPAAGLAIIAVDYLGYFTGELADWARTVIALSIIAALGALNYLGIHRASLYQKVSTAFKLFGLLALVVVAVSLSGTQESLLGTQSPVTATGGPIGHTVAAMMLVIFSYMGFDRVGYVAGEMKRPRRDLPLSLGIGLGIVVVVYLLANFVYHRTLGMDGVRESEIVASDMAQQLLGPVGAGFVAILVIVSTTGSTNGTMMAAPRVYYAMARDGLFFRWLGFVHPRYRTPSLAILAHCVWAAVILLVKGGFEGIVTGMVFAVLIFYALTTLALFKLRRKGIGGEDVYRMPLYPILPMIYLVGILGLIVLRAYYYWGDTWKDLAFVASGIPFWLYWTRRR